MLDVESMHINMAKNIDHKGNIQIIYHLSTQTNQCCHYAEDKIHISYHGLESPGWLAPVQPLWPHFFPLFQCSFCSSHDDFLVFLPTIKAIISTLQPCQFLLLLPGKLDSQIFTPLVPSLGSSFCAKISSERTFLDHPINWSWVYSTYPLSCHHHLKWPCSSLCLILGISLLLSNCQLHQSRDLICLIHVPIPLSENIVMEWCSAHIWIDE